MAFMVVRTMLIMAMLVFMRMIMPVIRLLRGYCARTRVLEVTRRLAFLEFVCRTRADL